MSRKGNCGDNAVAASFFHTMKTELFISASLKLELIYRERIYFANNYLSPVDMKYSKKTVYLYVY